MVKIIGTGGPDVVSAIETVDGQPYPTNGDDSIRGRGGPDILSGLGGNDHLIGATGADMLQGESGDDILEGGKGRDVLIGAGGDDLIFGNEGNDDARGGMGADFLLGNGGDDRLRSGQGSDLLFGGAGNDRLFGGAGIDKLSGDGGTNKLTGGKGIDYFGFINENGFSTITDFRKNDFLQIDEKAFPAIGPKGELLPEFFHRGKRGTADHAQILYDPEEGLLLYARRGADTDKPKAFGKVGKHLDYIDYDVFLVI
jgi:Ca2+-binding RTX toxin-like protein